jgi:PAP2 superfamily/Vanadium chloroperoxidase N-terminal domain
VPSADLYRVGPPPKPRSASTRRDLRRIERIQAHLSSRRLRLIDRWSGDAATLPWTEVALEMIRIHRPAAFPTRSARLLGLIHLGMHDALVAAWDSRVRFRRNRPFRASEDIDRLVRAKGSSYPDVYAAVAGAAERILAYLFPQEPPTTFTRMANQAVAARTWAGVSYTTDTAAGREIGHRVAEVIIAYGGADGHTTPPGDILAGRICSTPGCLGPDEQQWVPTPTLYQYPPTDPAASRWTTYLLQSPDQFRPPIPYAYGSPDFCAELAEVKQANDTADPGLRQLAFFWDDGPGTFSPAGHWNDIAVDLARNRRLSTERAARVFASMNAAIVDAFIATWDAKYAHWTQRPVTAIRERPSVCGGALHDPAWLSNIVTPPFPSYPSGHSAESGAAARVLQFFFPDKGQDPASLVNQLGTAGSFDEIADEVALSRMIGGIHYRSDNEDGLLLGRKVAGLAIQRLLGGA